MASTTRSASDYIKNQRFHLVEKSLLKNHSVILENLNQENSDKKKVLSDEEVCEIEQAEKTDYNKTRRILDSVIKKGEAACYEFLRIIYMTRKRTLDPDLHPWISCFPFKEDTEMDTNYLQGSRPCLRYQGKLKSKAQKISDKFWMANKNQFKGNNKSDLSYMSLVLDTQGKDSPSKIKKLKNKKMKKSRPKKLRTYIPEVKADISPSDLLKKHENILLVGKPGIGKTALAHEMLKLWAERDNKVLDYMFYFDMRETSDIRKDTSLEDLLFSVFSEPDEGKEEVLQDIKQNCDNVTLIFDGVKDLCSSSVVKRLVEKDLLPDATVIVTCRQDDEEEFASEDYLRVEVKGFSEQTIKTYLSAMLGEEQKKVLSNVELLTLCHVPMYALMVAVCFSFETPEDSPQPCTITEIYINIVRICLQINSKNMKKRNLNDFIKNKSKEILSLAEAAFHATEGKTVNLIERLFEDSCVLCFLKALFVEVAHTETKATYAFLHYTMQEFFAALWLLKNPEKIQEVFQQCFTKEKKHMKHLIPFMCRLLNEKSPSLMNCLIPAQELKNTSNWFFKEMITTLSNNKLEVDILFLCQCLYESQCPEACVHLLDKLGYHLDLSGGSLDAYPCCAVAYVITQSKERKISLDLEDITVSEQGMTRLFGCLENVQWCDPLPQQLWRTFLLSEGQMDPISLLGLDGNRLHLPVEGKRQLFERAVKVMQKITTKVNVCLHWDKETPVHQSLCESLFEALPHISSLSFVPELSRSSEEIRFFVKLFCAAAEREQLTGEKTLELLSSVCRYQTLPLKHQWCDFLLDLYSNDPTTGLSLLPSLQSVFQSAPPVWTINLSERKISILLEVLKLQSEKKQVELTDCSDEESEVRSFLQCLPYISQLSFVPELSQPSEEIRFFGKLFCAAAEREQQTGEKTLELLSSVCRYQTLPLKHQWCDFLLDLYSNDPTTGLSLLPSLQSVFQSAPAVWTINLSERKSSILLEVLKLQSEKKQVELTGCSDEESEVRSFLQCLPYISQLSLSELD
ncbi:protein NLRC5-like isoform X1 [Perca flavescens]|uniref:protein NLRC5-like isoform X1 n=1 Tax=Perca flavescens TaxID=8167 RepID=UPI00106E44D3|nr:protein NLRC5-like isoform X1 [Perca flavescens]XP_028427819.1 protein NLRC5-like isoform X1 [Perca flavescens]